jgi:hypothetical protein
MYNGGPLARLALEHPVVSFLWLLPALLSGWIASQRGGSGALWWFLGFVSGPLAWSVFVLAFVLNHHRICFACRKRIDRRLTKCPHCGSDNAPVLGV